MAGNWQRLGTIGELSGPGPHSVSVAGRQLVVFQSGETTHCLDGLCPHQGALLGEGTLEGEHLVCRNHGWKFDAHGQRVGGPGCLSRFALRRQDDTWFVELPAASEPLEKQPQRRVADLPGPKGYPIVGNSLQIPTSDFHATLERWANEYGCPYRFRLGPMQFIALSDPDLIANILRQRPKKFRRVERFETLFREVGADGVFVAEGDRWAPQRKLVMAALSQRHLKDFYPTLLTVAERLLERWRRAACSGTVLDVQAELMMFTVDITTSLGFAVDANTLGGTQNPIHDNITVLLAAVTDRTKAPIPYWRWFKLAKDRALDRSTQQLREIAARLIETTSELMAAEPERASEPSNFLEAMLACSKADSSGAPSPFDEHIIFGNIVTLLAAGEDTTANTIAWSIHELLDAPDAQRNARAAIDAALGPRPLPPDLECATSLEALIEVANETLRLRPVAPFLLFTANEDTVLGDVFVPAGGHIATLLRVASVDGATIAEPELFKPDRFRDPQTAATLQRRGVHIPFGSGPRICPGRSLALLEIQVALALLLRNFDIERVGERADVQEQLSFTMSPRGLRVRLHPRPEQGRVSPPRA